MEKVAIYLRKSRGEEEELILHKNILIELCNKNKWSYDIYEEIGSSDTVEERPEFLRLLDNIEKYKKLCCVALDRLSRNELHQAQIKKILKDNNVIIVTPNKTYDLNKEQDIILTDFENLLARQEYRIIKKRMWNAKCECVKMGYWVSGKPPIPYIYNKNNRELEVDEGMYKVYRLIIDKLLENWSTSKISCELNKMKIRTQKGKGYWRASTINRIAHDITQLGKIHFNGEIYEGRHKPVKTIEEHKAIEKILDSKASVSSGQRKRKIHDNKNVYALTNIIRCAKCGNMLTVIKNPKDKAIIKSCCNRRPFGDRCGCSGIVQRKVLRMVLEDLKKYTKELKNTLENLKYKDDFNEIKKIENELCITEKGISKLEKQKKKIKEMIKEGIYTIQEGKEELSKNEHSKLELSQKIELLIKQKENLNKEKKEKELKNKIKLNLSILDMLEEIIAETEEIKLNSEENQERYISLERELNNILTKIISKILWYRNPNDKDEYNIKIIYQ